MRRERYQGKRTDHFRHEESDSDRYRCKKGPFVLDDRQHDDDKDELRGQEHFDKQTLRYGCASSKSRRDIETPWEQGADYARRRNAPDDLRGEDEQPAVGGHPPDETKG